MAVATPSFDSGNVGVLRLGGIAGECMPFSKWKRSRKPNYENASNFCGTTGGGSGTNIPTANPTSSVGLILAEYEVSGLIDLNNPMHKAPFSLVEGTSYVLFLGRSTTSGTLVNAKFVGLEEDVDKQKFQNHRYIFVQDGPENAYPA